MSSKPAILVFAGSARRDSFNKRLARLAAESIDRQGGAAHFLDLRDYPMPLYDGDLEAEQGVPENARALRRLLASHAGLLIATPEYNGFVTPLLKNTLDWLSRPDGDESGLALFHDKFAALVSASPGPWGGMRSLALTRQLLANLGVNVLAGQLSVPRAGDAFDDSGALCDEDLRKRLEGICGQLVATLAKLEC